MDPRTLFALTIYHTVTRAQQQANGRWQVETLLDGQEVRCLAAAPDRPHLLYAGTQARGVLCSQDGGRTWQAGGLEGVSIRSLAVSAQCPGVVYAGTKDPAAVYASEDGGRHWEERTAFRRARRWYWCSPAEKPFTPYVLALALSPADSNLILAGIEVGAVLRSSDGGQSWSGHRGGADRDCHQLHFHPRQPNWAYQAGGGGPAVSRDGGITWRKHRSGLEGHYTWNVACDPQQPEIWYAVTAPFFKAHSTNAQAALYRHAGAAPWQKLAGGLPPSWPALPVLAAHPNAAGHLYLATRQGALWHSQDYGDSWHLLPPTIGPVWFQLLVL